MGLHARPCLGFFLDALEGADLLVGGGSKRDPLPVGERYARARDAHHLGDAIDEVMKGVAHLVLVDE